MAASVDVVRALRNALARADAEHRRAERTAEIAERHEQQLLTDPLPLQEFHLRMATTHRRVERQHRAAAAMHESHANRLHTLASSSLANSNGQQYALPRFMASVAEVAGADGAAVTLFGPGLVETLTVVSDRLAKAAQDIEFALGEGPARETVTVRRPVLAAGTRLRRRWPHYGAAVERLGIHSVAAVPVEPAGEPLGALTLFGPHRHDDFDSLRLLGGTVAAMLLPDELVPAEQSESADEYLPPSPLLAEADHRAIVHQAAGMLSVQMRGTVSDALALIRARAFAEDRSIESVASEIVDRRLRLV